MSFEIIIGGDIVPSFKNIEYFKNPDSFFIADQSCMDLLKSSDLRIYNLETPITDNIFPIHKDGANFAVSSESVRGLKTLMPDYVTLANNHCNDQGTTGLKDTVSLLKQEGIIPIGYGISHKDANDVVTFEKDGIVVSVVACAETEFNVFANNEIGAVPYHDFWTNKKISDAKKNSDIVIVLYHGGVEYFRFTPPYLRERCHLMAENGADYIFCQHSHCIGCYENYEKSTIVYGQGNFIFHQKNERPITKEGLLAKIHIEKNSHILEYIPILLNESDQICIANDTEKKRILEQFESRSQFAKNETNNDAEYFALAEQRSNSYILRFRGSGRFLKFIFKLSSKLKLRQYKKQDYIKMLNLFQNESHRELLIAALKRKISDTKGDNK